MKKIFLILSTLYLCFSSTLLMANENYALETGFTTSLGNDYITSAIGEYVNEGPVTVAFRVNSEGEVDILDLHWQQFTKTYYFEEYAGLEVELGLLGARYEKIHEALGHELSTEYADIIVRKAYVLNDGVTFILSGKVKTSSASSLTNFKYDSGNGEFVEPGKLYAESRFKVDLEATGEIRFSLGQARLRAYVNYQVDEGRSLYAREDKHHLSYQREQASFGLEYKPREDSNHKFGLKISQAKFTSSFDNVDRGYDETKISLTYQYRFSLDKLLFGKKFQTTESQWNRKLDTYMEEELELPEFQ